MLKVTLGQQGSKPGLLMPKAEAACTTQNKQHPLQRASPQELTDSQCPCRPPQLSAQSSAPPGPTLRSSPGPLSPTLLSPRRLTHVDPSIVPGLCSCWSWLPTYPSIAMAEFTEIKDIHHLPNGELSLAKNSGNKWLAYPRCCPQSGDSAA